MFGAIVFMIFGAMLIVMGCKNDIGVLAACGGFMICLGGLSRDKLYNRFIV